MKKLLVIGKNSRLYKKYRHALEGAFSLKAISHKDIIGGDVPALHFDVVLILSTSKSIKGLSDLYNNVKDNISAHNYVLLSSHVVQLETDFDWYEYVRAKKLGELEFRAVFPFGIIVRGGDFSDDILGPPVSSSFYNLLDVLASLSDSHGFTIDLPVAINDKYTPHKLYQYIFRLGWYRFCRFPDAIYRALGYKNYGYTFGLFKFFSER